MPTLRDRVRETLSAREPSDREARSDLDVVLERSRGVRPRRRWLVAVPAFACALAVWLVVSHRELPPAPAATAGGIHLYLHVSGEPEDRAVAIHLDTRGVN